MTRSFAAEGMSHNDYQKRALFSVTTPQNAKRTCGSVLRDASQQSFLSAAIL